jgi:hypothetical protein
MQNLYRIAQSRNKLCMLETESQFGYNVKYYLYGKEHIKSREMTNIKERFLLYNKANKIFKTPGDYSFKYSLNINVGVVYTLYMLYFTQPCKTKRVKIHMPLDYIDSIMNTMKKIMVLKPEHDVCSCLKALLKDCAIIPGTSYPKQSMISNTSTFSYKIADILNNFEKEIKIICILEDFRMRGIFYVFKRSGVFKQLVKPIFSLALRKSGLNLSNIMTLRRKFVDYFSSSTLASKSHSSKPVFKILNNNKLTNISIAIKYRSLSKSHSKTKLSILSQKSIYILKSLNKLGHDILICSRLNEN